MELEYNNDPLGELWSVLELVPNEYQGVYELLNPNDSGEVLAYVIPVRKEKCFPNPTVNELGLDTVNSISEDELLKEVGLKRR